MKILMYGGKYLIYINLMINLIQGKFFIDSPGNTGELFMLLTKTQYPCLYLRQWGKYSNYTCLDELRVLTLPPLFLAVTH